MVRSAAARAESQQQSPSGSQAFVRPIFRLGRIRFKAVAGTLRPATRYARRREHERRKVVGVADRADDSERPHLDVGTHGADLPGRTSNRPVEDWGKLLGDNAAVSAMLDRLLHHAVILKCGPRSYRTTRADLSDGEARS
ncbi:MAG: ATP-binding protein [Labilithrix sp.]|nr:ATP-binding protein [Labilithrix sp.]